MFIDTEGITKYLLYIVLFPTFFEQGLVNFAWAANDPALLMIAKRLFILLPVLAFILGCWVTVPALLSVLFRHNRREFVLTIFITWWDLGKTVVSFWGGILRFFFYLVVALLELIKIIVLGIWSALQMIIVMPFKLVGVASGKVVRSKIPWIAVFLTVFWVFVEATIFTYVTTPLVQDTLSNITGNELTAAFIRIPLFTFLFFIVLGSYAVLSTFVDSVKKKSISHILGIGAIEVIVMFVEVVFLYREFVDALVPWFSTYAANFEPSMFEILAVSAFMWFGIRSLSWFLFASHGTPTIMSVIQGKGLKVMEANGKKTAVVPTGELDISKQFMDRMKQDVDWVQQKGEELLAAFMLPPLQVVAGCINFLTLLITGNHLFDLPFKKIADIRQSKVLIETFSKKSDKFEAAAQTK